jgi:hypothetical protein
MKNQDAVNGILKEGVTHKWSYKDAAQISTNLLQRKVKGNTRLENSIKSHGVMSVIILIYSTALKGIRELYCLDGGHRLHFFTYLNLDFNVLILPDENNLSVLIDKIAILNNSSKSWTLYDFINVYCEAGKNDYKVLNAMYTRTGIPVGILSQMLMGKLNRAKASLNPIKNGTFEIKALKVTNETIDLLKKLPKMSTRMIIGFHNVRLTNDDYSFDVFKRKLKENENFLKLTQSDSYIDLFNSWF